MTTKEDFDLDDPVKRRIAADAELERNNDGAAYLLLNLVVTPMGRAYTNKAGVFNPGRKMVDSLWRADWDEFISHYNKARKSLVKLQWHAKTQAYRVNFTRATRVVAYLEFSKEYVDEKLFFGPLSQEKSKTPISQEQWPWIILDSVGLKTSKVNLF